MALTTADRRSIYAELAELAEAVDNFGDFRKALRNLAEPDARPEPKK